MPYKQLYGLPNVETLLRATLRYPGYCQAWNVFVQLGMTHDAGIIQLPNGATMLDFLECFLPAYLPGATTQEQFENYITNYIGHEDVTEIVAMVGWLGFFKKEPMPLLSGTPAALLQSILEPRWKLLPGDKDAVVMHHEIVFEDNQTLLHTHTASLIQIGDDDVHTAMAKLVGLPAAIGVRLILTGQIEARGVHIPITEEIYKPILEELRTFGVRFEEKEFIA
jgi:saccharopine dehydrogenase-like NADP-dependent oxidoreductase